MTTKQLAKLPHGTAVVWQRGTETDNGYVVNLTESNPNAEPPLVYVQWPDGQRTDGRDDWALENVRLHEEFPK